MISASVVKESNIWLLRIHQLQNLRRHHRHYGTLEVISSIVSLESLAVSKRKLVGYWWNLYQTIRTCFKLYCEDWKLVPGPFMVLINWQCNAICSFLDDV